MIAPRHDIPCPQDRMGRDNPSAHAPPKFVDVHCHCLPNLDDGPASMEDALALCGMLVEDHVSTVVATPHQLGRFQSRVRADQIHRSTDALNRELAKRGIELTVLPGAEVRLDERIGDLLAKQEILTLANAGRHILLELPWDVLIDIEPLVVALLAEGVDPILAHPERNIPLLRCSDVLERWLDSGVSLQVTAGSLTGDHGPQAQQAAWRLVAEGSVAVVASDAHGRDFNPPRLTAAFNMIAAHLGGALADLVCVDNPANVLRGESLVRATGWGGRGIR